MPGKELTYLIKMLKYLALLQNSSKFYTIPIIMNDSKEIRSQDDQNAPEIAVDIGALLKPDMDAVDLAVYQDWLSRLNSKESQSYEGMGYFFQIVKAIALKMDKIALLEEEVKQDRNLSFSNLIKLMDALYEETKRFRGRELGRLQTPQLVQLTKAVRQLGRLKIIVGMGKPDEKTFDQNFMVILKEQLPKDLFLALVGGASPQETRELLGVYFKALDLRDEEKAKFIQALSEIRKCIQKINEGKKTGKKNGNASFADLSGVVDALTAVEPFRRVSFQKEGQRQGLDYMDEIVKLGTFIQSTEEMFIRFGGFKLGNIRKPVDETENEKEMRIQGELDDKRTLIKDFSKKYMDTFPKLMVLENHMQVRKRRIASYPLFVETVESIKDEDLKHDYKRLLKQISTILSYLEWVWSMHEVQQTPTGKHIVYPHRMLFPAPFILREVEDLSTRFNILADKLEHDNETNANALNGTHEMEGDTDLGIDFNVEVDTSQVPQPFFPERNEGSEGLGIDYDEQSTPFRFQDVHGIVRSVIEKTSEVLENDIEIPVTVELPDDLANEKLKEAYWGSAMVLNAGLNETRPALRATHLHNIPVNEENQDLAQVTIGTLSYDIHDFINLLIDDLSTTVYQLVKAFKPEVTKKDVLPEFEKYEEQAAELRKRLHYFIERLRPVNEVMAEAMANPGRSKEEKYAGVEELKEKLIIMHGNISNFRAYQEKCLTERRSHAILRGASYETLVRMTNTMDTIMKNYIDEITAETVDLYALRKQIGEFSKDSRVAMQSGKLKNSGVTLDWVEETTKLEKIEEKILANNLTPDELAELEQHYINQYTRVLNMLETISGAQNTAGPAIKLEIRVTPKESTHFTAFLESNPFIKRCQETSFTPAYFKFQKLMRLMENLVTACGMTKEQQSGENRTREQLFIYEYDVRQAKKLEYYWRELLLINYSNPSFENRDRARVNIEGFRTALDDLWFRKPEEAEGIQRLLTDLEDKIALAFDGKDEFRPKTTLLPKDMQDILMEIRSLSAKIETSLANP